MVKTSTINQTKERLEQSNPMIWLGTYEREGEDIDRFYDAFGHGITEAKAVTNRRIMAFKIENGEPVPVFEV